MCSCIQKPANDLSLYNFCINFLVDIIVDREMFHNLMFRIGSMHPVQYLLVKDVK